MSFWFEIENLSILCKIIDRNIVKKFQNCDENSIFCQKFSNSISKLYYISILPSFLGRRQVRKWLRLRFSYWKLFFVLLIWRSSTGFRLLSSCLMKNSRIFSFYIPVSLLGVALELRIMRTVSLSVGRHLVECLGWEKFREDHRKYYRVMDVAPERDR